MPVTIRKAEISDVAELTAIAFEAKRHWGYPEAWIDLWADELTIEADYPRKNWVILAADGDRVLGWCAVSIQATEYWLDYCWVLPEAAGRGLGRRLVHRALNYVTEHGAKTLKVIADPNAEGFYGKLGFRCIGYHPSVPEGRQLPVMEAHMANDVLQGAADGQSQALLSPPTCSAQE